MDDTYAIILAAGKGTRMKSDTLKVCHTISGKPIIQWVLDAIEPLNVRHTYVVVGHHADQLTALIARPDITFVTQAEQRGTGHAVRQVEPMLHTDASQSGTVIVLAGDCPLISTDTLHTLIAAHTRTQASGTLLSTHLDSPGQYGRIIRNTSGELIGIREAKDCSDTETSITEINSGIYVFNSRTLFESLSQVTTHNAQQEYYLTDIFEILAHHHHPIAAHCTQNNEEILGVNTPEDLAAIQHIVTSRINQHWIHEGVTIVDPESTVIEPTVHIGHNTVIEPHTSLKGATVIGAHCTIKSHSTIRDETIPDSTVIESPSLEQMLDAILEVPDTAPKYSP